MRRAFQTHFGSSPLSRRKVFSEVCLSALLFFYSWLAAALTACLTVLCIDTCAQLASRERVLFFCFLHETPVTARNIGLLFQLGSVLTAQLSGKLIALVGAWLAAPLARGTSGSRHLRFEAPPVAE